MTLQITTDNFSQVVEQFPAVLLRFHAEWCGPCKMLAPILEELKTVYESKVKFVEVNVDESPELATKYGVMGIPTTFFVKNGLVMASITGLHPKADYEKAIKSNLL